MSNVVGRARVPTRRTTNSHTSYSVLRASMYRQAREPASSYGSMFSVHSGKRLRPTQMTASTATIQRIRNGVDTRPTLNGIATASSRSIVITTVIHADISLVLKQQQQLVHFVLLISFDVDLQFLFHLYHPLSLHAGFSRPR